MSGVSTEEFYEGIEKDSMMYKVVFTRNSSQYVVEVGSFDAIQHVAAALRKDGWSVKIEKRNKGE
jgi:hypothetical protein